MITSITAENGTDFVRRHKTQETNKQGLQQSLVVYP